MSPNTYEIRLDPFMHKSTINILEFMLPQWPGEQRLFQCGRRGPNQASPTTRQRNMVVEGFIED